MDDHAGQRRGHISCRRGHDERVLQQTGQRVALAAALASTDERRPRHGDIGVHQFTMVDGVGVVVNLQPQQSILRESAARTGSMVLYRHTNMTREQRRCFQLLQTMVSIGIAGGVLFLVFVDVDEPEMLDSIMADRNPSQVHTLEGADY